MTSPKKTVSRLAAAVIFNLGAWAAPAAQAQTLPQVKILTSWFAQADQAGYWQAGQAPDKRVGITVIQGGPKIQTIPQVASGQSEFGVGNADDILLARARGAPVKAVFAHLDHVPYTLVYHADPSVRSVADLKDRTFAVNLGFAYWEWLKKQSRLVGTREIPVTGDLSLFRNDPKMVQQGYSLYLPARMKAAGLDVQQITLASLGYRPYDVLFTTDEMIEKHPEIVRATVAAVKNGWTAFVHDPYAIKPTLMRLNQQIPPDVHDAATADIIENLLPHQLSAIGCMTDARWTELSEQLKGVGFLPRDFDPKKAYDRKLVEGC